MTVFNKFQLERNRIMEMSTIVELVKILKEDNTLYSQIKAMIDTESIDETTINNLAAKAAEKNIPVDANELTDNLDTIINEGVNGISLKALGGLDGIIDLANNFINNN